ncbi:MAG: CHRD domain-containing protein [Vicinamibacterales bacterium]
MTRLGILIVALALAGCDSDTNPPTGPSSSGSIIFTSELLASNEVPTITGPEAGAGGAVTITFEVLRDSSGNITGGGSATFAIQLNSFPAGTPAIAAHIHPGPAGTIGGVLVNTGLSPAAPILLGDGTANVAMTINTLTQAQAAAVLANPANFYFNVHTPLNPGGAVRGQLVRIR